MSELQLARCLRPVVLLRGCCCPGWGCGRKRCKCCWHSRIGKSQVAFGNSCGRLQERESSKRVWSEREGGLKKPVVHLNAANYYKNACIERHSLIPACGMCAELSGEKLGHPTLPSPTLITTCKRSIILQSLLKAQKHSSASLNIWRAPASLGTRPGWRAVGSGASICTQKSPTYCGLPPAAPTRQPRSLGPPA